MFFENELKENYNTYSIASPHLLLQFAHLFYNTINYFVTIHTVKRCLLSQWAGGFFYGVSDISMFQAFHLLKSYFTCQPVLMNRRISIRFIYYTILVWLCQVIIWAIIDFNTTVSLKISVFEMYHHTHQIIFIIIKWFLSICQIYLLNITWHSSRFSNMKYEDLFIFNALQRCSPFLLSEWKENNLKVGTFLLRSSLTINSSFKKGDLRCVNVIRKKIWKNAPAPIHLAGRGVFAVNV